MASVYLHIYKVPIPIKHIYILYIYRYIIDIVILCSNLPGNHWVCHHRLQFWRDHAGGPLVAVGETELELQILAHSRTNDIGNLFVALGQCRWGLTYQRPIEFLSGSFPPVDARLKETFQAKRCRFLWPSLFAWSKAFILSRASIQAKVDGSVVPCCPTSAFYAQWPNVHSCRVESGGFIYCFNLASKQDN